MFFDELQPLIKELLQQPIAFAGGFVAGAIKLKLTDDPLKSWLEKQGLTTYPATPDSSDNKPQSITIE